MADYADLFSSYLQNRMDTATQPFTDPSAYAKQRLDNSFPTGETEEEKKKRMAKEAQDAANREIQTQQIKTYADGSQEHNVTTQVPAPVAPTQSAPTPTPAPAPAPAPAPTVAPTPAPTQPNQYMNLANSAAPMVQHQPVAPVSAPTAPPVQQAPVQQAPTQPVVPQGQPTQTPAAYNQYIAQQESANPNIGYHNPALSSAYGQYGITAPAYQDIQAANPQFANRPITSLTPAEQAQANETLRGVYGNQLKAQGVEPTESNLRLSHLLGATGAKKYLENGYLSPEAAAANGGEAKLRQIAESRMGSVGQPGMQKVGLATPPAGTHYEDIFHASQNDPQAMAKLSYDKEVPEYIRKAAADQHLKQLQDQQAQTKAQTEIDKAVSSGNTNDFARLIKKQGDDGSYIKAYLFQRFGLTDLAKQEQQKLGADNKWMPTVGPDGERAIINYDGNNLPVEGYDQAGKRLTGDALAKFAASGVGANKAETTAEVFYNPMSPSGARFSYVKTPYGGRFVEAGTGRQATPQEQSQLVKMGVAGPVEQQAAAAYARGGAGQQGKQAAETGTQQAPLAPRPGAPAPVPGAPAPAPGAPAPVSSAPAPGPVNPNAPAPTPAAIPTATPTATPGATPTISTQPTSAIPQQQPGEPYSVYKARLAVAQKEAIDIAEGNAKTKLALPQYQAQADNLLTTVTDVVNHKGFEANVGVRSPLGVLQLRGTEARNWQSKYKQLMGQEFLDAFAQLRGAGAISDKEGAAATQARAALSDPGIDENEFKRNAKILEDTIKKGVNRQRILAGKEPEVKYMLGDDAKKNKQAYEWAKANPNDPMTPDVLKKLGIGE